MENTAESAICYLCGKKPIYMIESHFVPAAYLKNTLGKRNSEFIFSVSPILNWKNFYGRENINNTDPEIKQMPFTAKGIFCKACENGFERWERICTAPLLALNDRLDNEKMSLTTPEGPLLFLELVKVHPNVLQLFFYSMIWRQLLQQRLNNFDFHSELFDKLKNILLVNLLLTESEVNTSPAFETYPEMTIFTTVNKRPVVGLLSPNIERTDPFMFFIGPYNALIWAGYTDVKSHLELPQFLFDTKLQLPSKFPAKIGVISYNEWMVPIKVWDSLTTSYLCANMAIRLGIFRNIPFYESLSLIIDGTAVRMKEGKWTKPESISQVYEQLIKESVPKSDSASAASFDPLGLVWIGDLPPIQYFTQEEIVRGFENLGPKYEDHPMQLASYLLGKIINDMAMFIMEHPELSEKRISDLQVATRYMKLAMRLIKDSNAVTKNWANAHYALGEHTADAEMIQLAINEWKNLLTAADSSTVHYHLALCYKALALISPNPDEVNEKVFVHVQESIQRGEAVGPCYYTWAIAITDNFKWKGFSRSLVEAASEKFESAIAADPSFLRGYTDYISLLRDAGNMLGSIKDWEKAAEVFTLAAPMIENNDNMLNQWGTLLWSLATAQNYNEPLINKTLEVMESSLLNNPQNTEAMLNTSTVIIQSILSAGLHEDKLELALSRLRWLNENLPKAEGYLQYGYGLSYLGRKNNDAKLLTGAIESFKRSANLDKTNIVPLGQTGAIYFLRGKMTGNNADFEYAAEFMTKALSMNHADFLILAQTTQLLPEFQQRNTKGLKELLNIFFRGVESYLSNDPNAFEPFTWLIEKIRRTSGR